MWIGTQTGLQRYDGISFKNYQADIRDSTALQSDWISSIFEDRKNRLWIGSDPEGPSIMNRITGKFYNYNLHATAENRINGVWHFAEEKNGSLWIAGHDGLYRLNESNNQFEKYNARLGLGENTIPGWLAIDTENNFWIGTTSGIKFYNQKEKKLYGNNYNPHSNPLFDIKEGIGIVIKNDNDLWFTSNRKVYRYNFSTNKTEGFSFEKHKIKEFGPGEDKEDISGLYSLQNGEILVPLAGRGLAFYQPELNKFFIAEADNTKPYSYHINKTSYASVCIAQDRAKNTFIGSDKGINIYNPDKQFFQTHLPATEKNNIFPRELVNDFLELPDGNILVSYYNVNGGIAKMDSNFHFNKQYLFNSKGSKNSGSNQIWNLFRDNKGIIWAPNQNRNILKLNLVTGNILEENDAGLSGPITTVKQDAGGNTWMGHWKKGLVKIEAVSHKKYFYSQFIFSDSANKKRVQCILLDGDKIWAGTVQNGLQVFDKKKERFIEAFTINEKSNTSISSNCVTDIIKYNRDTLIVATLMGVNIFDINKKLFKTVSTKEGLPNNLVQTVIKDQKGNVWAACYDNGICKINIQNFSVTNYDENDGKTDNIFTSKFYQLQNGKILIGTSAGFISFNPSAFAASATPANVNITGVHVFEKETLVDSLLLNHLPLKLTYSQNSLRFNFASVEFWNPGSIRYYYKLEGIDEDWIRSDKSNAAVYNQLKDGGYIFNVKCANRDGVFCRDITQLKIIITAPFWKTWWFRVFMAISVALLIYLFIKGREKHIEAIASEKLKVQQLNADQYKSKLELEQIINYFSSSLIDKNTVNDVLWDLAKNLIGRLGFVDCMIYLWNDDKTNMVQKAGHGPKDSEEKINLQSFVVLPGQGVVGHVMQTKEAVVIADTSLDSRYRADDLVRLSEMTVPIIYNDELIGIIDSEHPEKNFYTTKHLQLLTTIATLVANKITSIQAEQRLQQTQIEMYSMNEQLSKAKLEALRSQMNPHFIFNSLNAIQECILTNNVDAAYEYLSKFSKLQRMVLNNSQKELIPLSSEVEMLQLYLSLESLRFSKSFSYKIDITGVADTTETMIPSLITQPLVENAIWHGLRNKEKDKILSIIYKEQNGKIFITIDDNGIGREKAGEIKKQKLGSSQFASKGIIMLQQRLQVLSQQLNAPIEIITVDKKDENGNAAGTNVTITLPSNLEPAGEDF